jgi:hypothetical protein
MNEMLMFESGFVNLQCRGEKVQQGTSARPDNSFTKGHYTEEHRKMDDQGKCLDFLLFRGNAGFLTDLTPSMIR